MQKMLQFILVFSVRMFVWSWEQVCYGAHKVAKVQRGFVFPLPPFSTSCLVQTSNRRSSTKLLIPLYMTKKRKMLVPSQATEKKSNSRTHTRKHRTSPQAQCHKPPAHTLELLTYSVDSSIFHWWKTHDRWEGENESEMALLGRKKHCYLFSLI